MSKEEAFWSWFQANESRLFEFEKDQDRVFADLRNAIDAVDPDLTFEFGPNRDGVREFIISAGGLKSVFPSVEALAAKAPPLQRWQIVKYRQRKGLSPYINFEGSTIRSDQVRFTLEPDGAKAGITLFMDGYTDEKHNLYGSVGFLYLDNCLGEYDVATKAGFIEFKSADAPSSLEKKPLSELTTTFDNFLAGRAN